MFNKRQLKKIFVIAIVLSVFFNPLVGDFKKVQAQTQDVTSPGVAVGKAVGAAAACFTTVYLANVAKEWLLDQPKATVDPGVISADVAAGVAAGSVAAPTGMPVKDTAVGVSTAATAASIAAIAQTTAAGTNKTQSASALSESQKCLRDTVVKILGDYLVDETIRYIQGEGKPRFVQDWRAFSRDAVNTGIGEVIRESGAAFLCEPFAAQVKISLFPVGRFKQKIDCTLDQIVGNIDNFMVDFRNGGWIGYGSLWQPNNNYFGQILLTYDEAARRGAEKKEAALNKALAGGGFLPVERCVQKNEDEIQACLKTCAIDGGCGTDDPNEIAELCTNLASCSKYESVTPGKVVAEWAIQGTNWDIEYLKMTQSWIAAITNAVVNRAIEKGLVYMGASNPPDTNVNAMATGANTPVISESEIGMAKSQILENVQNIKTNVINNEREIYNLKIEARGNFEDINAIYLDPQCTVVVNASVSDRDFVSNSINILGPEITRVNDSYLIPNGGFQIDANQILSLAPRTDISVSEMQQKYQDFTSDYREEIFDASSGEGKAAANNEVILSGSKLAEVRNRFAQTEGETSAAASCRASHGVASE